MILNGTTNSTILAEQNTIIKSDDIQNPLQDIKSITFAIRFSDGRFRKISIPKGFNYLNVFSFNDTEISAQIKCEPYQQWILSLTVKKGVVSDVWFPLIENVIPLNNSILDDYFYYPYLMGVIQRADSFRSNFSWGLDYPGQCISPLVVVADKMSAYMISASNWPPRRVSPQFSRKGISLRYATSIKPLQSDIFKGLIVNVQANSFEETTWQLAVDVYKSWLKTKMQSSGLYPLNSPDWMWDTNGILNVQLQNMPEFDLERLLFNWKRSKKYFKWIIFWGQMSNYAGPRHLAVPKLKNEEVTGCCLKKPKLHARYYPELINFAHKISKEGYVGFYSRPEDFERYDKKMQSNQFLSNWLKKNREEYGANSFYIDIIGNRFFGAPLEVAYFLRDRVPAATLIEFPVDVYPTAFLISGALNGGNWKGGPEAAKDINTSKVDRSTFPEFGRYILDDRLFFLGQSNGDHQFWGPDQNYWTERQAFLLGTNFDAITIYDNKYDERTMNSALELAIEERNHVKWSHRRPIYQHRKNITYTPANVDVRVYRDKNNETLFVIDNWMLNKPSYFRYKKKKIYIPNKRLSIISITD